jgi:hypothetical protein
LASLPPFPHGSLNIRFSAQRVTLEWHHFLLWVCMAQTCSWARDAKAPEDQTIVPKGTATPVLCVFSSPSHTLYQGRGSCRLGAFQKPTRLYFSLRGGFNKWVAGEATTGPVGHSSSLSLDMCTRKRMAGVPTRFHGDAFQCCHPDCVSPRSVGVEM